MNRRTRTVMGLLALGMVLLAAGGCIGRGRTLSIGDLQTESRSGERGSADSVRVEIEMGAGELELAGGAAGLLEADFTYNVAEFKPEVEYNNGRLVVRQPDYEGRTSLWDIDEGRASLWDVDDYRYEWHLRLNDDVSTEMSVKVGAGQTNLDLGSLSLTELNIEAGAGEVRVAVLARSGRPGNAAPARLEGIAQR